MTTQSRVEASSDGWSIELEERLHQLRISTLVAVLVAVAVLGILLLRIPDELLDSRKSLAGALALGALAAASYQLQRWRYEAGVWLLFLGTAAMAFVVITWTSLEAFSVLLIVPIAVANLLISIPAGIATSLIYSVIVVINPAWIPPLEPVTQAVTLVAIWILEGALIVTLSPLLQTVQWAWAGYERGRAILEQSRDYQQRLHETLEDLKDANAQLMRLHRLAQTLREAAENERRIKEQFVANVSHELRTPLNMIVGFCEMIIEAPQAYGETIPPMLLADLDVVYRNSQHLSSLVDDVLDLSQVEAGQMALVREHVPFSEIVEAAVTAVRPLYATKSLDLTFDIPDDLPLLFCDRVRLREVMLNLLSNAGRFTDRGGVRIEARRQAEDLIVSVADTGPGIPRDKQARLFRPFEQLDGSIRRRYGGTGLGLSISRSFVELHGGRMWVESQEGSGTTFFFSLPMTPAAPMGDGYLRWVDPHNPYEPRTRPPRLPEVDVKPRWVIVEGGDTMHHLLERHVDGVDLVPTRTLAEALETLEATPGQALLINDLEVGRSLRALQEHAPPFGVPAIVCSIPGTEEAANGLGVSGYLVKPISRDGLLTALAKLDRMIRTILIVDDERDALTLFRRMLLSSGHEYRVLRARNGRQALQMLRQERPDVILLDLMMPGMDGFEFLRARQGETWADVPVILISARDPLGQPIVSNALAVTLADGLSVSQVLRAIEMLTGLLAPGVLSEGDAARIRPVHTDQQGLPAPSATRAAPLG